MSTRSLLRRLSDEGTSYKDLLDEVRSYFSKIYLREEEMAVCEVAYLLGFSEPSNFYRSFRRWTGTTPGEYRRTISGREK